MRVWLYLPALLLATACQQAPWRLMPIQLARVVQTERYYQTFIVPESDAIRVYTELLGPRNWNALEEEYGGTKIIDAINNREVLLEGSMVFVVYLDPETLEDVIVEASGKYFLVVGKPNVPEREILIAGDFTIDPTRVALQELQAGSIRASARLVTSRIPGRQTYLYTLAKPLVYTFYLDNISEKVFSLDYERPHDAVLGDTKIAEVRFEPPVSGTTHKLIDLRGLIFVHGDYGPIRRASIVERGKRDVAAGARVRADGDE